MKSTDPCGGATVWLTGLPSAGKSTLAEALADQLRAAGRRVEVLDGDEVRRSVSAHLGFSREDRAQQVRLIAYLASMLARNGVLVLVPVIAPFADLRKEARFQHERQGLAYIEVYVATPLGICADRDVKGLYARQRAGELTGLTGVDDPYEIPEAPEVTVSTAGRSVAESVASLWSELAARGLVRHGHDHRDHRDHRGGRDDRERKDCA